MSQGNICVTEAKELVSHAKDTRSVHQVRVMERQNKRVEKGGSLKIKNCLAETAHVGFCAVQCDFHGA